MYLKFPDSEVAQKKNVHKFETHAIKFVLTLNCCPTLFASVYDLLNLKLSITTVKT